MGEKLTPLSDIGEFGLIDKIKAMFPAKHPSTKMGIGDDAAVLKPGKGRTLVTTDLLLEGVHFDLSYTPLHHLGYKAVAVNVSDIAAMNGTPRQITLGLGISSKFTLEAMERFLEGVKAACDNYGIDLIGGDITSSRKGFFISITALGEGLVGDIVYRNGAKVNDIICVTGDLGGAFAGLNVLEREKQVFIQNPQMQPKLDKYQYIVQRQLKPEARMDIIHELREKKIVPTAMIDVSDGLASELLHIANDSKVSIRVFEENLPIDKITYDTAVEFNLDPVTFVMNGGEDYELLFTISQEDFETLKNHPDIHFIGFVQNKKEKNTLVTKGGNEVSIQAQGWRHLQ